MKLVWTTRAKRDLREIISHIWQDDPEAAKRMGHRLESYSRLLATRPLIGRPGAIANTREAIPHPSYRFVYQVTDQTVSILTVIHTSRQWPPVGEDD